MDEDKCVELLEKHGVKSTANRIMIVKALAEEENPKSVKELEDKLVLIENPTSFVRSPYSGNITSYILLRTETEAYATNCV